jgi:two-component system response regulator
MITSEIEILLVEDKKSDAEMTMRAIRKHHALNSILHVSDGKLAVDFLFGRGEFEGRDMKRCPKVILLDLKIPKLSGVEVLQKIKANEHTRKIPVVVLTSSRETPDIEQCYLLGVNSYVVKPVVFNDFMEVVSNLGLYWMLHNQLPY